LPLCKNSLDIDINIVYIAIMKQWTPDEIRNFRKQLGLSQTQFASMLGVTQVYISYMEGGVKKPGRSMKLFLDCIEEKQKLERKVMKHGKDKKKG
jgi:predicted transcriptional regulator